MRGCGADLQRRAFRGVLGSVFEQVAQHPFEEGRIDVQQRKILRQGNEVRVIVELVNAGDGYQVWSHHYDDNLKNIFAVQDNISAAISGALKVKFATAHAARSINPQAHDLVLQTRALIEKARSAAPF